MSFNQLLGAFDFEITNNTKDCSASEFIQAAIKTGLFVDERLRQSILCDISDILECNPEDLNFLFETGSDEEDISLLMVPSRRDLREMVVNDAVSYKNPYPANDITAFNEAAE